MKIAIFYHCLFHIGNPPQLISNSVPIIYGQMAQLDQSGLLGSCDEMVVGVNGDQESLKVAKNVFPPKAKLVMHGMDCHNENLTIVEAHKWAQTHPDWAMLYFHGKGVTHAPGSFYGETVSKPWRKGMMEDLVDNWRQCVADLKLGYDIACSYWLWNAADGTQHIPEGNFLWARSDFVAKLPSIYERARIKISGIKSPESRWEAEVFWGNGPKPRVKQYRTRGWSGVR